MIQLGAASCDADADAASAAAAVPDANCQPF